MIRSTRSLLLATGLFAITLLAGGCESSFDSADLRSDWTPELQSTAMSDEQFDNFTSRHRHNYTRQVYDDWAMIWFENRNLKLTEYVMP